MITGDIVYTGSLNEFGILISKILINIISDTINNDGKCNMAVSGGRTPLPVYNIFTQKKFQDTLDWSKVHLFFIDERCVPADDKENNFKLCFNAWLKYYPEIKYHRIQGWLKSEEAATNYENEIKSV
ncbi:MAG: hypothetical protein HN601_14175, partial [Candidatus Marinimicrobia bacterium]|nr:hypothetical protein [Candidatus Neomarinimicrobiota bacterium]